MFFFSTASRRVLASTCNFPNVSIALRAAFVKGITTLPKVVIVDTFCIIV